MMLIFQPFGIFGITVRGLLIAQKAKGLLPTHGPYRPYWKMPSGGQDKFSSSFFTVPWYGNQPLRPWNRIVCNAKYKGDKAFWWLCYIRDRCQCPGGFYGCLNSRGMCIAFGHFNSRQHFFRKSGISAGQSTLGITILSITRPASSAISRRSLYPKGVSRLFIRTEIILFFQSSSLRDFITCALACFLASKGTLSSRSSIITSAWLMAALLCILPHARHG